MGDEYRKDFYNTLTGYMKKAEQQELKSKQLTQQEITVNQLEDDIEQLNKELSIAKNESAGFKRKFEKAKGFIEENKKLKIQLETMKECMSFMRMPMSEN
jgi:hypothetical protein